MEFVILFGFRLNGGSQYTVRIIIQKVPCKTVLIWVGHDSARARRVVLKICHWEKVLQAWNSTKSSLIGELKGTFNPSRYSSVDKECPSLPQKPIKQRLNEQFFSKQAFRGWHEKLWDILIIPYNATHPSDVTFFSHFQTHFNLTASWEGYDGLTNVRATQFAANSLNVKDIIEICREKGFVEVICMVLKSIQFGKASLLAYGNLN